MTTALDLGCGTGNNLAWTRVFDRAIAVDIDRDSIAAACEKFPGVHFLRSSGERLPLADDSVDSISAYVSLPYMDIPKAIRECSRVLKSGGEVFFSLHLPHRVFEWWARDLRTGNWKGAFLYQPYVVLNGLLFHWFGFQFRFPLKRWRCESFQTERAMRRLLTKCGFDGIEFRREGHRFLVTATRVTEGRRYSR